MNKKLFLEDKRSLDFIIGLAFFEKHVDEWIIQCHTGTINVKEAQEDFKKSVDGLEKSFRSMILAYDED